MEKIYTAGFDIFYPDAVKRMEENRALCQKYQFEPYFQGPKAAESEAKIDPLAVDIGKTSAEIIFRKNLKMIEGCDLVAANLNPFRGEMDCGTAFEIGYAYALGKPVYGYMKDVSSLKEKNGGLTDWNGFTVENFGQPINLMIGCSVTIVEGSLEECLKKIAEDRK